RRQPRSCRIHRGGRLSSFCNKIVMARARGRGGRLGSHEHRRPGSKLRSFPPPLSRGLTPAGIHDFVSRASEARPGTPTPDLRPWVPAFAGTNGWGESSGTPSIFAHVHARLRWTVGTRFATGRSPCGAPRRAFRAHSSVGRAADS